MNNKNTDNQNTQRGRRTLSRAGRAFSLVVLAGMAAVTIGGAAQATAAPEIQQTAPKTGAPYCMTIPCELEWVFLEACKNEQRWQGSQGQDNSDTPVRGGQNNQGGPNGHRVPDQRSLYPGYWVNQPPPL